MSDAGKPSGRWSSGVTSFDVSSYSHAPRQREQKTDWVIVEEPLEIRISGEPYTTTMRTPGHDHELAAGFLLAEGLIRSRADLGSIRHCDTGPDPTNNVVDVLPAPGSVLDTDAHEPRRHLTTSACGLCGRDQIDDLVKRVSALETNGRWPQQRLRSVSHELRTFQTNYEKTGGGHAAAVIDQAAQFLCVREDIGRHNAVDKVLGRSLLDDRLPLHGHALLVSGRISFEIVQKAAVAGVELVLGVSAPSSLAVATARRLDMTLIGFSRPESFNVYAGQERVLTS